MARTEQKGKHFNRGYPLIGGYFFNWGGGIVYPLCLSPMDKLLKEDKSKKHVQNFNNFDNKV